MALASKKDPKYFTATKNLVRLIRQDQLSGRKPRVSSVAFERATKKGRKEPYLSVNCSELENTADIIEQYFGKEESDEIYTLSHKIQKINAACEKAKNGTIEYSRKSRQFNCSGKPAYEHHPNESSYSHTGIMFMEALNELEEKAFAIALTDGVKPRKHTRAKKKR